MKLALALAMGSLLVPAASADVGIGSIEPPVLQPGDTIRVTVSGFLGPRPWKAMPVVIVHAARAPRPKPCRVNRLCTPALLRRDLDRPPYRLLGSMRRWQPIRGSHGSARAVLRAEVPKLVPGRYVLGLFCAPCTPGPKGSLIVDERLVVTIRG